MTLAIKAKIDKHGKQNG